MEKFDFSINFIKHPELNLEMFNFVCGDFIGGGCSREVFQYALDENFVVKIEQDSRGHNWLEWNLWNMVRWTEHKKWFAECTWISTGGRILIQRKTSPLNKKPINKVPDDIPKYLTDIKPSNFGWIGNQLTCHDYAFTYDMLASNGGLNKRMQTTKGKLK
jgi:hypothetical protein